MPPANTPTLETPRLLLRRFAREDIPAILAIYSDKEVNTYLPMFPLTNLAEAEAYFEEEYAKSYRLPTGYNYAVCLKEDNVPIGYVTGSLRDSHDFGYALIKKYWHQGIATEASQAVIEQMKKDGLGFITATHDVNNPRSGGVMKQLGMTYRYSYQEQWQPKDIPVIFRMYQLNFHADDPWVYRGHWEKYPVHFIEKDA